MADRLSTTQTSEPILAQKTPGATSEPAGRSVHIATFGCQMNVHDSERMADLMEADGYRRAASAEEADVVVLNTCHIREKAAEKVYSEIGRLRVLKQERKASGGKPLTIAVTGCVAQAEGEEIMARAPVVDVVAAARRGERPAPALDFEGADKFAALPARPNRRAPSAFVSIQEGCDKFCTFCVVPYTRGAEFSRPAKAILDEVRALAASGVSEITVLGQNVNAYHGPGPGGEAWSLARLLAALADIGGVERLRYTTSHPRDMSEELIAAHGELPALMPFLHLPVQSGSDRILKAMNRGHTAQKYLDIITAMRSRRPDLAVASDFIVGFPGETEQDFEDTLELARRVKFAQAFSFKYSPRPGTPGAGLPGQLSEECKSERLARLQALLFQQQTDFNRDCIGRTIEVLFERPGRMPGQIHGRSPYLQAVHAEGPASLIGSVRRVEILAASQNSLTGKLVQDAIGGGFGA